MGTALIKVDDDLAAFFAENQIEWNNAQAQTRIAKGEDIYVSDGLVFEQYTRHANKRILATGAFTHIVSSDNDFFMMDIGRYCSIARGSRIVNGHHPLHSVTTNPYHYAEYYKNFLPEDLRYTGPIEPFRRSYGRGSIGNDVWIGGYCIIRSGVKIGHGSVIAAGSVVMKDVPPYSVVGGNPATEIKKRFPEEIVSRLLNLAWWQYDPRTFRDINMYDVLGFVEEMEKRRDNGDLAPFAVKRYRFAGGKISSLPSDI